MHSKSIPTGAEYVTLQFKIRWKEKQKNAGLAQENGFPPTYVVHLPFAKAGECRSFAHLLEKSVIHMI